MNVDLRDDPVKALGNTGEMLALCRYIDRGYRLIQRNWRLGRTAEIDLILFDPEGDTVCFCEVKTRTAPCEGRDAGIPDPSDSVRGKKRMKIKYASRVFMETHREFEEKNVRFDVAEVYNRGGSFQVRIIKDAF
jgi:putative endonuclease